MFASRERALFESPIEVEEVVHDKTDQSQFGVTDSDAHVHQKGNTGPNNCSSSFSSSWGGESLDGPKEISYAIRTDDEIICVISVCRKRLCVGDIMQVWASFDKSTRMSHSVTATLTQRENRCSDGALLKV